MNSIMRPTLSGCLILLGAAASAHAQMAAGNEPIAALLRGDKLLSLTSWVVPDGNMLSVVTEKMGTIGQGTKAVVEALTIYRQGATLTKLFETEKIDGIVSVTPLAQYDGDLLVGWVKDGGYHLEIYAYINGKIQKALDAESGIMPEIAQAGDGKPVILITRQFLLSGRGLNRTDASTTAVYKRNGAMYEKLAEVPWAKRLEQIPLTGNPAMKP